MLLLLACAEPFDVRRQDLGPFRIAAVGVVDGVAAAAVYSGAGMGHEQAPTLSWSLDGEALGEGWDVPVSGGDELELRVDSAAGHSASARVSVAAPEATTWTRNEDDGRVRITLEAGARSARWMTVDGVAEVVPLEPLVGEVVWEEPGQAHHLALVQDGEGGNRWTWIDTAWAVEDRVRHEGRLLEGDTELTGPVAATLSLAADGGVGLANVSADVGDTEILACMPEPVFRTAWVAEGRCGLDEVLGARVEIELW